MKNVLMSLGYFSLACIWTFSHDKYDWTDKTVGVLLLFLGFYRWYLYVRAQR